MMRYHRPSTVQISAGALMSTQENSNPKARTSIVSINRELRRRLVRAGQLLMEKDDVIQRLSAQVTGAPEEAKNGSGEYVRMTRRLNVVERERDEANRQLDELRQEMSDRDRATDLKISELSEELLSAKQEVRKLEQALDRAREARVQPETAAQDGLWKQVVQASMHAAGLEAQISAMRLDNAHSELLKPDESTGKSRLRQIYEDAHSKRANQLNVSVSQPVTS